MTAMVGRPINSDLIPRVTSLPGVWQTAQRVAVLCAFDPDLNR